MRSIECFRRKWEYDEPWTCSASSLRVLVSGSGCLNESFEIWRLNQHIFFYEAALCLARSTNDSKWTEIGAESVKTMTQLVECSEWNFRNKVHLLDAELHTKTRASINPSNNGFIRYINIYTPRYRYIYIHI